jgi:hypothetical protein
LKPNISVFGFFCFFGFFLGSWSGFARMASRWGVVLCVLACAPRARAPSPPRDLGGFSLPRACSRAPAAAWVPRKGASWQAAPQQLRHGELALRGGGAGGARAGGEADGQSETESMPALQEIIYVAPKRKWQRYSSARARAAPGTPTARARVGHDRAR